MEDNDTYDLDGVKFTGRAAQQYDKYEGMKHDFHGKKISPKMMEKKRTILTSRSILMY